ncbi:MAG: coproporphyrinogen-III oxidase family protein [Methylococcus sp.]
MLNTRKDLEFWNPKRTGFVTNYPNFLHWKPLAPESLGTGRPLNIYVHTPFCIQRCSYCYYKTVNLKPAEKRDRIERYVDALCREIELASAYYHLKDRPVVSVYFGGGTPTLLEGEQLAQIAEALANHLNLSNPEFTVEAEPVTLTESKAEALRRLPMNRISMGVQSFNDEIIARSHRLDNEKKAMKAIAIARDTGAVVNIDLMSGLADETEDSWAHSVSRAIESGVDSITVYKTELYTNTPYYKEMRKDALDLPSEAREMGFMEHAVDTLEAAGYGPWSFYTFTQGGDHQHVYATSTFLGDDCYAFGVSAFGKLGDTLFQNSNEESTYLETIESGRLPIVRGHRLSTLDAVIRDLVLGLKLVRFDLGRFRERHGFRLETLCDDTLERLVNDGYIAVGDDAIHLTRKGILHGDYVGKSFARRLMDLY